jgi:hypothetical protein
MADVHLVTDLVELLLVEDLSVDEVTLLRVRPILDDEVHVGRYQAGKPLELPAACRVEINFGSGWAGVPARRANTPRRE